MAWLGLNRPLAKLNATRIPLMPVIPIRVSLNTDDETNAREWNSLRNPVDGRLQGSGIDVRINTPSCKQNQVPKEVCFKNRERERLVSFHHLGKGSVEVFYQVYSNLVR